LANVPFLFLNSIRLEMSSGYTSIQCHAGEAEGDDDDNKMFNDKFHREASVYDSKVAGDAMFPDGGDAGIPPSLHLSTSVVKTNLTKSVTVPISESNSTNICS